MATKKTVRKAPAKKSEAPKAAVKVAPKAVEPEEKIVSTPVKKTKIRKPYVVLVVTILLIGAALYYFRGLFVAAVVNGQPISRLEVIRQTEQQSGKQTLETLVRNSLIEQEAKKQNVIVTEQEINDEIKKLEGNLQKQGQKLDQVLQAQGMSQQDLRKLIRLDKLVAKMVGKDVTVSNAEVAKYIADNAQALPKNVDEKTLKQQVSDQLKQQKTNAKVRDWLAQIQKDANVRYYVQY
jgi:foldase protein PrsA